MLSKNHCGKIIYRTLWLNRPSVHLCNLIKRGKEVATLLQPNAVAITGLKLAFSCAHRSRKVRNPKLHAEGTECLQASRCTLLVPEVSGEGVGRPTAFDSFVVGLPLCCVPSFLSVS